MSSAPLTIYHFPPSSHSRATVWSLRLLGIDVDIKPLNLFEKEQLCDEFVRINPQHCVPTLRDGDFVMWESRAIATYAAESRRPDHSAWPQGDANIAVRARIAQRLYFDAGTLYTRIRAICYPVMYLGETRVSDEKRKSLQEAFGFLETFLADGDYVAGTAEPTLADVFVLASLTSIVHAGADLSGYPKISAWYERCRTLPGFDENEEGAKVFGARVKSKLEDTL